MDLFTLLIVVVLIILLAGLIRPVDPQVGKIVTIVIVALLIIYLAHGYPWHGPVLGSCR